MGSCKQNNILIGHKEMVTCLKLSKKYLISGSKDTTIILWSLRDIRESSHHSSLQTYDFIFQNHSTEVCCLAVDDDLDMLVSISINGNVEIFSLISKANLKSFSLLQPEDILENKSLARSRYHCDLSEHCGLVIACSALKKAFTYSFNFRKMGETKLTSAPSCLLVCNQWVVICCGATVYFYHAE